MWILEVSRFITIQLFVDELSSTTGGYVFWYFFVVCYSLNFWSALLFSVCKEEILYVPLHAFSDFCHNCFQLILRILQFIYSVLINKAMSTLSHSRWSLLSLCCWCFTGTFERAGVQRAVWKSSKQGWWWRIWTQVITVHNLLFYHWAWLWVCLFNLQLAQQSLLILSLQEQSQIY